MGEVRDSGLSPPFACREGEAMSGPSTDLHRHLRAWRHSLGLTLEQVANAIGSKVNTISGWETGKRAVDLDDLKRLADRYGVHPAVLLYAPAGSPQLERVNAASELAAKMAPAAADVWIAMGKQLADSAKTAAADPGTDPP